MKHLIVLLSSVFLSLLPALAVAQSQMPERMPLVHSRGFANTIVRELPEGDRVIAMSSQTAFELAGQPIERGAVLVRVSATGIIRWTREVGHEDAIIYHAFALPDGNILTAGVRERGFMSLVSGNGEELWSLSPAGEYNFFDPVLAGDGSIVVLGRFTRGTLSLPGVSELTGRRQFNHYLGELDPMSGRFRWARTISAGIEEAYLAIDVDGTILVATHERGSGGQSDTVVDRYSRSGEPLGTVYRRGRTEQNHPHGLRVMDDGSYALLSWYWRSDGGGDISELIGLERDGSIRYLRDVPYWGELVDSADRSFVEVYSPVTPTARQLGMDRFVLGVRISSYDRYGELTSERTVLTAGSSWVQSSLRVDRTSRGVWISGYETDGAARHERFLVAAQSI